MIRLCFLVPQNFTIRKAFQCQTICYRPCDASAGKKPYATRLDPRNAPWFLGNRQSSSIHSASMLLMRRSGIFRRHSLIITPLLSLNGTRRKFLFCLLSSCRVLLSSIVQSLPRHRKLRMSGPVLFERMLLFMRIQFRATQMPMKPMH